MKKSRIILNQKGEKKVEVFKGSPCYHMAPGDRIEISAAERAEYSDGYSLTAPKSLIEQGQEFSNNIQKNGVLYFTRRR